MHTAPVAYKAASAMQATLLNPKQPTSRKSFTTTPITVCSNTCVAKHSLGTQGHVQATISVIHLQIAGTRACQFVGAIAQATDHVVHQLIALMDHQADHHTLLPQATTQALAVNAHYPADWQGRRTLTVTNTNPLSNL